MILKGFGYYSYTNSAICEEKVTDNHPKIECGKIKEGLPFYTEEEIKKHATIDKGIWVSYKNGVYDITDFVEGHPGKFFLKKIISYSTIKIIKRGK